MYLEQQCWSGTLRNLNTGSRTNRCDRYSAPTWWHRGRSSSALAQRLSNSEPGFIRSNFNIICVNFCQQNARVLWILNNQLHTLNPDGANGTSKFIEIGGRVHFFLVSVSSSSISAESWVSFMPAMRLILKNSKWFSLAYRSSFLMCNLSDILPNNSIFWGLILGLALQTDELHTRSVQWRWYFHLNLLSQQRWFEIGL